MSLPSMSLDSGGRVSPYDAPDIEQIADVPRCECCGKPLERDDVEIQVDTRDLLNWMAALWWKEPRAIGLILARLILPRAPLSELACMTGCSKPTTTRLWQKIQKLSPPLAQFIRGAERRGGNQHQTKKHEQHERKPET